MVMGSILEMFPDVLYWGHEVYEVDVLDVAYLSFKVEWRFSGCFNENK